MLLAEQTSKEVAATLEAAAPVSLAYETLTLLTTVVSTEAFGAKYSTEPSSTALSAADKFLISEKSMATEFQRHWPHQKLRNHLRVWWRLKET